MIVIDASEVSGIPGRAMKGLEPEAVLLSGICARSRHRSERSAQLRSQMGTFPAMLITRHIHTPMVDSIRALRDNLTGYDAAYLVLAQFLDA